MLTTHSSRNWPNDVHFKWKSDMKNGAGLATGVFFANWLLVPLVVERSFTDGFGIGTIAGLLVLGFCAITKKRT